MDYEYGFGQFYNQDFELAIYKKTIDQDYRKISHKFGNTSRLSPNKLEIYNQHHLYNKLFKNEKQRKSIQVKAQTINPMTAKHFLDNKGRFINQTQNKVYDVIKGKYYIMQLGQIPLTYRSKTPTYQSQSGQYTQTSFYQGSKTHRKRSTTPSSQRLVRFN
ncbi:unnamed protein product (macronuclear) [Paramecium tetraurelia]|uniref:Doublecortin domain-containing protein n=1 Tax=Paramecium tetraurelia TaxID=5888 RepID=A0CN54_PARTE|nr:uncharacterized protein GSPATT00008662001 [Paramecium tetraurelia]CAK72221.1 unnamed protein product [Paramecium tetraurelia]|eukprot:XP_001439618.1 hypothetical protein (macronuclear) [Paramecium tetraurelia strain d4-2]